ncbi:hypothetical protein [Terrisporobacter hibernicus]|uniref:Cxxc_20_cxxc protein n=1 Tax=Terrisporobacter hibernicus TaxID=2813371 RepID=A0AAX2ZER9_9FIRM|nr:hypothetical protein [Terrisporobacter hibernicus]UEL47747.1 hypothetical protein JW646_19370 [Terrisporobacter hibernicus]
MKSCPKCNNKISLSSIVKSTTTRSGFIRCNECKSKFRMKYHWFISITVLVIMILILTNLNMHYVMSRPYVFFRGLLVAIVTIVVYIALILFTPWQEK